MALYSCLVREGVRILTVISECWNVPSAIHAGWMYVVTLGREGLGTGKN